MFRIRSSTIVKILGQVSLYNRCFVEISKNSILILVHFRILAGDYPENTTELGFKSEGPHTVEVTFTFEENESGNFAVRPSELLIETGEFKTISIYALPNSVSTVTGKLFGRIKDNPDPIVFQFSADGVLPTLSVETKVLDFGRLPLNFTERQNIIIHNPTVIPVFWTCEKLDAIKNLEFGIHPTSGTLKSLNDTAEISVEFTAPSIPEKVSIKKAFRFIATDNRKISAPIVIQPPVSVQAEAADPRFEIGLLKGRLISHKFDLSLIYNRRNRFWSR